ncbi:Clc-like protein 5 [Caenorhabditis elegans]|uniref:Clc-like protein 5 n=1 Tax=Caenorhabditis elegans TaxID=6239 RepID=CLC5_CAEEL|nr:Clc-like protein 5 [Caenorhabditis elegans]Q9NGJ7.1 RecName: Full=Clc-like protein 5 [Caenorhabditis elegans]AAF67351.1 Gas3/PMP22-like protein [Caenorhabditis elegans]CCD62385.1 Clc-like protein 5 [Caenorhabditis elegans]|eukprot:NP_509258.1 Clc-like protein 5 [Caenorhabditis elegans]
MLVFQTKLQKYQLATLISSVISNFLIFFATITPAWQVADDLDADRYVQSGLWLYCPGQAQCWYIFSDSLINYYEKVDVCRFFLIGDCRKKLLRTPYFFGWHYAVLILNVISMICMSLCAAAVIFSYVKPARSRISVIMLDVFAGFASLLLCVSLIVFMVNAEMLESKYLIGIKNTYEKEYGYSYYLAGLAFVISVITVLFAALVSTYTFLFPEEVADSEYTLKMSNNQFAVRYNNDLPQPYQPPMSQLSMQIPSTEHGSYIAGAISPRGDFKSQTRHFYSY